MNISVTNPEIAEVLTQAPQFQAWTETVQEVEQAIATHPTEDSTVNFDRFNPDHIIGQINLNGALAVEKEYRDMLRLGIAGGLDGALDALASIAVLQSIDRFNVKPKLSPCRVIVDHRETSLDDGDSEEPKTVLPVAPPNSIDDVLTVAELIDKSSRIPRQLIRGGVLNKIVIVEGINSVGRSPWYKPFGDAAVAHTTITTTALFNEAQVTPVDKPRVLEQGSIIYDLPLNIEIDGADCSQTSTTEGRSDLPVQSNITGVVMSESRQQLDVPLIGLFLANGNAHGARFFTSLRTQPDEREHRTDVEINGFSLPIDPREFLPKNT